MAKQASLRNNTAYSSGHNHGNVLRSKAQQFYSASSGGFRHGPKQERSRMQAVNTDGRREFGGERTDDVSKQNDFTAHRMRSENVGRARPSVSLGERQSVDTGGIRDRRVAVSETRGGYQNERELFDNGMESYPRKERPVLREDNSRRSFNDENSFSNQSSRSLSARNNFGRVKDVRSGGDLFVKPSSVLSVQEKSQTFNAVDVNSSGRSLSQGVEPKTNDSRVVSRSGSLDRRKVQVKQTDIGVLSQAKFVDKQRLLEKNKVPDLEGSRVPASAKKQAAAEICRVVGEIDYPRQRVISIDQKASAEDARNNRYAKCFSSSADEILPSSTEPQISHLDTATIGIADSVLRHSFQEGDRKGMRKVYGDFSAMDVNGKHLHARQGSDPTTQFTGARKLSTVSQDLMRSKEELINRSRECGRMLEEYRQREEERREHFARNEKRPEPPTKTSERKLSQQSNEKDDQSAGSVVPQDRKLPQDRIVEEEQGKQSPRNGGKRKTSYIDSWIQSQQLRISSLASAIKEEDSDDNPQQTRSSFGQQGNFVPKESLVAHRGRDDSRQDTSSIPVSQTVHIRSYSGDEIMGIANTKEPPKISRKVSDGTQQETGNTKVTSPRDDQTVYSPEYIRMRSLSLQQKAYSRTQKSDGGPKSPVKPNSSAERKGNYIGSKAASIPSSRSQSERTSPQLQRSFGTGKSSSVGNSPRSRRETTFESNTTTTVVSPTSPKSPPFHPVISRCSSSASDYTSKEQQQQQNRNIYQQQQQQLCTPNRSGNEDQFDWPAPPDLEVLTPGDDPQNHSWPNSSSSPFMNHHSHPDGSRNFPVAVVKPLQHEKTRSWDGAFSGNDTFQQKPSDIGYLKNIDPVLREPARNDIITCYNVSIKEDPDAFSRDSPRGLSSSLSLPRDHPSDLSLSLDNSSSISLSRDHSSNASLLRDASSTSSQEFIQERCIDGLNSSGISDELSSSDKGLSNLITQDFQWYRPHSQSTSSTSNLERDATRESMRDSTHERLGRFKRGSKLLSSKYQSFSKSLENLSKVGKDLIKGKKKGDRDEKKNEKSKKNQPERKSMVVGDLELNDEFAMKMERRSRLSYEQAGNGNDSMKELGLSEARQNNDVGKKLAASEARLPTQKKKETLIDFPLIPIEADKATDDGQYSEEVVYRKQWEVKNSRYDNQGPRNDVIRRREVKSAYYEDTGRKEFSARPKSEFYENVVDHQSDGFEDCDDPNDEEEKEMVKIVRKISGLRSSQVKKKSPLKQDGQDSDCVLTELNPAMPAEQFETIQVGNSDDDLNQRPERVENGSTDGKNDAEITTGIENEPEEETGESVSREGEVPSGETDANANLHPDPMKRISWSLSRVMTDLRELREQDLTLATQLITLGKSIKHFKNQKKEMDDLYATINEGDDTEDSDSSAAEEEDEDQHWWSGTANSGSRISTDF